MSSKPLSNSEDVIYQSKAGSLVLKAKINQETIWLTQDQIAKLFDVQKAAISKHIKNIFDTEELDRKSTVSKMETVRKEGKRKVKRNLEYYNLDLVLSVGYRVSSRKATHFRQWATKTLKDHIVKGFSINIPQAKTNYKHFIKAVEEIKDLLPSHTRLDHGNVLDLVILFSETWLSLDAYDRNEFKTQVLTKKKLKLKAEELSDALRKFKQTLIERGEASDLFGQERFKKGVEGIVGNVMQSFDNQDVYSSIEEKAANLLYLIIKNHPFIDGNKRSGAYAFIWFLQETNTLDITKISPQALTALTLLVAESSPGDKEKMVSLICLILSR